MELDALPIQKVNFGNKQIYLLGTAHISEESVQEVIFSINEINPSSVAVELDWAREQKITQQENSQWKNLNMFKVIRQKKAMFLLSNIVLSAFQRRLGDNLSMTPGQEMLTAINESRARNIPVILADRSAEITLKRAWNKSTLYGRAKIFVTLISVVFSKETISEEELNELKQKSAQGHMMEELSTFLPELKSVLVDERDQYLATNIMNAYGDKVLAVLGAAHVLGIKKKIEIAHIELQENLNTQEAGTDIAEQKQESLALILKQSLSQLEEIPPKNKRNILSLIVPLLILGVFAWGFYRGGMKSVSENFMLWWLINGGLSMLGALIALAHPVTIILSLLAAPLTSLNPFIGVGLVTGLSETFFRSPRVQDVEEIQFLSLSVKALYKNRITRILIVFVLTTLGSAIGTFVGLSVLVNNV